MPVYSKIYVPCKKLGSVSNHIPVVTRYIDRRRENLLVTCVGRSFHTYGSSHFSLLSVSGLHDEDISCIAADRFLVFAAAGNIIKAWRRGAEVQRSYEGHSSSIHLMLPFGPHLISVDEDSCVKVWDIKSAKIYLELEFSNNVFQITTVAHPTTYLNKILFGSEQGSMQLWNLQTSKLIYTFKGWGSSVTVLEQTPAVDVMGIGLKNGHIKLHNLKFDEVVMEFHQDWGLVTALTFRLDNNPIMVSGTTNGYMVMWNLDERKVFSQVQAHAGSITGLKCLPNEPLMVTSSPDNSLKLWIFDMPDGGPRLLRVREGHSLPPTYVRFYGASGKNLLSSGGDSTLRIFNTLTDQFNKSLGRASYNRKASKKKGKMVDDPLIMPPIVQFTSETIREKEWDNIAAIHAGVPEVTTWSYDKLKMGELKLLHERFRRKHKPDRFVINTTPTSLCLTHCGNFVLVGYSSGHCDRFNIQSGMHRASYGNPAAHQGAIRGVSVDALSQFVITGGEDGLVKWWSFKGEPNAKEVSSLELEEPPTFFTEQTESSLIGVGLEDFTVAVVDSDARSIVRRFAGHSGRLTDAAFSADSRWLITSSMDCCICTWDIPSGCLIDVIKVSTACISLSFSPTSELLATAHVDDLGVYLWSNKAIFNHVSWKPLVLDGSEDLPVSHFHNALQVDPQPDIDDGDNTFASKEQIDASLVTLSTLANSRWQNLLNIDVVKRRNKPKEAPKAPKSAPFFLPTIPSLNLEFDLSDVKDKQSTIALPHSFTTLTVFGKLLWDTQDSKDFVKPFTMLKSLGPSTIDFEIRSLSGCEPQQQVVLLNQFLKMSHFVVETRQDFELAQAYLGLFLKVHGENIIQHEELVEYLDVVQESFGQVWKQVRDDMFYNSCVVQTLKNT